MPVDSRKPSLRAAGRTHCDKDHALQGLKGLTPHPIGPVVRPGGEEALRTVYHAKPLAKLIGAPYIPIPPWIVPLPLPFPCELHYGEPLHFEGTGDERDAVIDELVGRVRARIEAMIEEGRTHRRQRVRAEDGR